MVPYAAMDWTTSVKDRDIRGVAVVAINDLDMFEAICDQTSHKSRLRNDHFFHAFDDSPAIQLSFLNSVLTSDLIIRIGAVIYDASDGVSESAARLPERDFNLYLGVLLLREFLPVYPVKIIDPDSDLGGKRCESKLIMDTREMRKAGHILHVPKIRFPVVKKAGKEVERKSPLVQLADLIVYNLYRDQRGVLKPQMQKMIADIRKDPNNIIRKLKDLES